MAINSVADIRLLERRRSDNARTAERVRVCQRSVLITLPEVVKGANEARDQIFANFWSKLGQQSTLRVYVGVRNGVAGWSGVNFILGIMSLRRSSYVPAETVPQDLHEVVAKKCCT
jgi:hypothetical protein